MQFAEAEVSRLSNAGSCSTLEPPSPLFFPPKGKPCLYLCNNVIGKPLIFYLLLGHQLIYESVFSCPILLTLQRMGLIC